MSSLPLSRESGTVSSTGRGQWSVVLSLVSSVQTYAAVLSAQLLIGLSTGRESPGNVYSTNSWVILMHAGPGSASSAPVTEDEKHRGLCQLRSKGRGTKVAGFLSLVPFKREKHLKNDSVVIPPPPIYPQFHFFPRGFCYLSP